MVAASSSDRERGGKEAPKILESQHAWLLARLAEQPEPMVRALTIELAERGNPVSPNTVWVLLRRAGHSLKKRCSPPSRTDRRLPRSGAQWKKYHGRLDPRGLVFVDETWASTNMAPLRGSGPRGKRLMGRVPQGRWRTTTFIAALRCARIDVPCVQPPDLHRMGRALPRATLKPGDVVILDNLSSHKGKAARQAIRAVGPRLLFLPPYSPDLNPIEQVFAKLKHLLRKAAERSIETTWRRIGSLLDAFPQAECANYLRNSGYELLPVSWTPR
ncbi:IS630 family transposase [Sphingomonas sp.]|uniref:IS630 family transposase n=1 Tax=Sphingomonas sp. TaxID=28214 RepID=UPI0035B4CAB7